MQEAKKGSVKGGHLRDIKIKLLMWCLGVMITRICLVWASPGILASDSWFGRQEPLRKMICTDPHLIPGDKSSTNDRVPLDNEYGGSRRDASRTCGALPFFIVPFLCKNKEYQCGLPCSSLCVQSCILIKRGGRLGVGNICQRR